MRNFYEEHGSGSIARRECGTFWVRIELDGDQQYQWSVERDLG
jgi:hypothetical protein